MADKQTEYRIWHGRLSSMLEGEIEDIRYDAFNEFDAKVASGLIPVLAFKTMQRDFVLPIIRDHGLDMSDFMMRRLACWGLRHCRGHSFLGWLG